MLTTLLAFSQPDCLPALTLALALATAWAEGVVARGGGGAAITFDAGGARLDPTDMWRPPAEEAEGGAVAAASAGDDRGVDRGVATAESLRKRRWCESNAICSLRSSFDEDPAACTAAGRGDMGCRRVFDSW